MKRALVLAVLVGCSRAPRRSESPSGAPRVEPPPVVSPPPAEPAGFPTADQVEWDGDKAFPSRLQATPSTLPMPDGGRLSYDVSASDDRVATLRRFDGQGKELWQAKLPAEFVPGVALAEGGARVFTVVYSQIATGADVIALDAWTGAELWRAPVHGVGPIGHSKYSNRVEARVVRGALVVQGNEAGGMYLEAFDPRGKMLWNKPVTR